MAHLDTIIGQNCVQSVREGIDQAAQELASDHVGRFGLQPGEDRLGCPVDTNEQMELALFGSDFSDVDVDIADRLGLEF